jgi:hypothetical protein
MKHAFALPIPQPHIFGKSVMMTTWSLKNQELTRIRFALDMQT